MHSSRPLTVHRLTQATINDEISALGTSPVDNVP